MQVATYDEWKKAQIAAQLIPGTITCPKCQSEGECTSTCDECGQDKETTCTMCCGDGTVDSKNVDPTDIPGGSYSDYLNQVLTDLIAVARWRGTPPEREISSAGYTPYSSLRNKHLNLIDQSGKSTNQ